MAKTFEVGAQPPVQRRTGDIAQGSGQQQEGRGIAFGEQQSRQDRFRLQGQQGGRAKGEGGQAEIDT